jgi:hypothetical protein
MRTGQYGALEMMSPPPERGLLDTRMAEALVYARIMEFHSIKLEVRAFLSQANEACGLISAAGFRRECFSSTIP